MCSKKADSVLQCAIWVVFALYIVRIYSFDVMKWYIKWRISLTLCTIGCLAHADHKMIHFLINESRILPQIELPLKHVSLADSAELQGKSGILPLCATHIWDSPSSQEIFWLLLAVQFWGRKKKKKNSYVLEFYNCSRYWVSFMSMCVILLVFLWWALFGQLFQQCVTNIFTE